MSERINGVKEVLGRQIMIEHVSSDMEFDDYTIPELEFLAEVADRSGCGILLDINNIDVSASNHGFRATDYLDAIPVNKVGEMHLAGHSVQMYDDQTILVDTHDAPVCDDVWALFEAALRRFGTCPTLIEWDSDLPALTTLLDEANKAQEMMDKAHELAA